MRPREAIAVRGLGPDDVPALARLRLEHPGGIPNLVPGWWAGAFDSGRLVAAAGWIELMEGHRLVVEVNRRADHWGALGVLVIMRRMIASGKAHGIRVQTIVPIENVRLKKALRESGARPLIEIWEVP
jgi:hypothetical protein